MQGHDFIEMACISTKVDQTLRKGIWFPSPAQRSCDSPFDLDARVFIGMSSTAAPLPTCVQSTDAQCISLQGMNELARLKRELARVKKERDFLHEAATFFAKGSS